MSGGDTSILLPRLIVRAATRAGVCPLTLLQDVGLEPRALGEPLGRVGREKLLVLIEEATRRSGDDCFGLHAAREAGPESLGLLGGLAMASSTLGDALRRCVRYLALLDATAILSLDHRADEVHLALRLGSPPFVYPRQSSEFALSLVLTIVRRVSTREITPRRITFQHPAPRSVHEIERAFECPVGFNQALNSLVLDPAVLDERLPFSNPRLLVALELRARTLFAGLSSDLVLTRVRQAIFQSFGVAEPTLPNVAAGLGLAPARLKGELAERGTSFASLLDAMRHELAVAYVGDERWSIQEISALLGFHDPSVFQRSFKRWTGLAPLRFRQKVLGTSPKLVPGAAPPEARARATTHRS